MLNKKGRNMGLAAAGAGLLVIIGIAIAAGSVFDDLEDLRAEAEDLMDRVEDQLPPEDTARVVPMDEFMESTQSGLS